MRRILSGVALVLAVAAFPARSAEPPSSHNELLAMAATEALHGDPALACNSLDALLRDTEMGALPEHLQLATYAAMAVVFPQCDRAEEGLVATRKLVAAAPRAETVSMLAYLAEQTGRHDEAADALVRVAREWPANVGRAQLEMVEDLNFALRDSPDAQRAMLQRLFDVGFDPVDGRASDLWFELARLHLDAGDVPAARAVAARIDGVSNAVAMRIDRRFDPLTEADPSLVDVRAQGQRALAAMRAKAEQRPNDLGLQYEIVDAYLMLGDHAAVDARVTAMTDTLGTPAEEEASGAEYRSRMLLARATMHRRNGDIDKLLEDADMASLLTMNGWYDFGRITRGQTLCDLQRTKQAAAAIDPALDDDKWMGPLQRLLRLCIAVNDGDLTAARAHLAALQAKSDRYTINLLLAGQLSVDDLDAAAATYIAMLQDPLMRTEALEFAQIDRDPPVLPGEARFEQAFKRMLERDDVRAAVEKVGRVMTWDLFIGYD